MKIILVLLALASVFAQPQDNNDYDGFTKASTYQACLSTVAIEGGTACIVYSNLGANLHFSIMHSADPIRVASVDVILTVGGVQNQVSFTDAKNMLQLPITGAANFLVGTNTATTVTIRMNAKAAAASLTWTFTYYDFVRTLHAPLRWTVERNGVNQKFAPTYVETFQPLANRILLSHLPTTKTATQGWTYSNFVVVATGPAVSEVSEGQIVLVNKAACYSQLLKLNNMNSPNDDVLTFSPYCWVAQTDILGIVSEATSGANRAIRGVGHIKQANPTGFIPVSVMSRNALSR